MSKADETARNAIAQTLDEGYNDFCQATYDWLEQLRPHIRNAAEELGGASPSARRLSPSLSVLRLLLSYQHPDGITEPGRYANAKMGTNLGDLAEQALRLRAAVDAAIPLYLRVTAEGN